MSPVQGIKGQEGPPGAPGSAGSPVSPALPASSGLGGVGGHTEGTWARSSGNWGEGPEEVRPPVGGEGRAPPGDVWAAKTERHGLGGTAGPPLHSPTQGCTQTHTAPSQTV